MKNMVFKSGLILLVAALSGCGGGDSDFSGTFVGRQTIPIESSVTVTLAQNGRNLTGNYSATGSHGGPAMAGQLTGTAQGAQAQVTLTSSTTPGLACSGIASQTQGTITGSLACSGGGAGTQVYFQVARQQQ